mgnify:CR=1 FL=1|jgi:hypothetical protein
MERRASGEIASGSSSPTVPAGEMRSALRSLGIELTATEASSMGLAAAAEMPIRRLASSAEAEANKARATRTNMTVGESGIVGEDVPIPGPRSGERGRGGVSAQQEAEAIKMHLLAGHLKVADSGLTADNTPKASGAPPYLTSPMLVSPVPGAQASHMIRIQRNGETGFLGMPPVPDGTNPSRLQMRTAGASLDRRQCRPLCRRRHMHYAPAALS